MHKHLSDLQIKAINQMDETCSYKWLRKENIHFSLLNSDVHYMSFTKISNLWSFVGFLFQFNMLLKANWILILSDAFSASYWKFCCRPVIQQQGTDTRMASFLLGTWRFLSFGGWPKIPWKNYPQPGLAGTKRQNVIIDTNDY